MKSPLSILHLEDSPEDSLLALYSLEREGIACAIRRVQTRADFLAALEQGGIDLILADLSMPGFDGWSALQLVCARWPDLPFILVSGTVGEQTAIDSLKCGATDYVLKTRLSRLAPAVRRTMREVEERAERRRLQAQFIEAQKMEIVGHLAGGVAHDFNNILAVIMGYSDLILQGLGPEDPIRGSIQAIRHAAEGGAGLTRQLLVFSRKEVVETVVLDLNHVLKDLDKILRHLIGENIELKIVPGKRIGRVKAHPGYIGQVLMNLVVNARDAMPGGGKLTIATSDVTLRGESTGGGRAAVAGDYVLLSVQDTGTGMTEDVKARLFEAFFTTKPKGRGTGLGLATCQTIIEQSNGHIDVASELGNGTTFMVYFPRVEQPLDMAQANIAQVGPLPRGNETVLLVEDEPAVRQLAHSLLKKQGYNVLLAVNGQEGLRVAHEHQGPAIRLVVTDVIMPVMGGKVMVEWLKASCPDVKVLFTSGYTDDAAPHESLQGPGIAFLPKPYTPTTFTRKVRELLDRGAGVDREARSESASGATPEAGWLKNYETNPGNPRHDAR